MRVSKDVQYFGDIKVSVVSCDGGYAIRRSDIPNKVFLRKDGGFYKTHTDAIKGVDEMIGLMLKEIKEKGGNYGN